jgi:tRNA_anti-like
MTVKLKRAILFFFTGGVLIAFIAGYLLWNKPHRDIKNANAIEINAGDLYNIFTNDSTKAIATYLNKVIKVSGIISSISFNQKQQQIILLKTMVAGASVNCTMEENTNNYKEGDTIILKGICSGYISGDADMDLPGDVFLIRCYNITRKTI